MTLVALGVGVLLLVVTVGGIAFNSYILFFSCTRTSRQNRSATQLLLLHLGLLNLFLAATFLVAFSPGFFRQSWLNEASCSYVGPIWEFLHIVTIWTVMALNLDKYITIASPLHYARFVTPAKAVLMLFLSWLLAVGIVLPPSFLQGLTYEKRESQGCVLNVFDSSFIVGNIYVGLTTFLGFILPILIVGIANGRILIIASHHRHRIVAALWDVTISAQATVTPQKSHFYLTNYRGRSAASTFIHHVGSLLLMYLPTAVCRLYEASTRSKVPSYITVGAFILVAVTPAVNSFVYGVKSKVLRRVMLQILRKKLYKSEVTCEIQARTPSAPGSRRPSITPSIITLPLQKQLTRRMSEILTPTAPSISSNASSEPKFKLERQSSDLSWNRIRGSGEATLKEGTTHCNPKLSPLSKFFPKFKNQQLGLDLNSASWESTASQFLIGARNSNLNSSSMSCNRQGSVETMVNGSTHNGGHRQSLRRALFARNKQKSLDLDTAHSEEEGMKLCQGPPRSISHQQMQEPQLSPSLIRPLILESEPLCSSRKSKKVSWSSDSFSISDRSSKSSPKEVETDPDLGRQAHKKRRRKLTKQSSYKPCAKFTFNESEIESDMLQNNHFVLTIPNGADDEGDSEVTKTNTVNLHFIAAEINVVENPLGSYNKDENNILHNGAQTELLSSAAY